MKALLYFIISFCVCAILGLSAIWAGFALIVLFINKRMTSRLMWEILIGVLCLSILTDIFPDGKTNILRTIIPVSAAFTAFSKPRGLIAVFSLSIISLLLKNDLALGIMGAMLLQRTKSFYHKKKPITR